MVLVLYAHVSRLVCFGVEYGKSLPECFPQFALCSQFCDAEAFLFHNLIMS